MANKKKPTGLGKGIEALFQDNTVDTSKEDVVDIKVSEIKPNPYQPVTGLIKKRWKTWHSQLKLRRFPANYCPAARSSGEFL